MNTLSDAIKDRIVATLVAAGIGESAANHSINVRFSKNPQGQSILHAEISNSSPFVEQRTPEYYLEKILDRIERNWKGARSADGQGSYSFLAPNEKDILPAVEAAITHVRQKLGIPATTAEIVYNEITQALAAAGVHESEIALLRLSTKLYHSHDAMRQFGASDIAMNISALNTSFLCDAEGAPGALLAEIARNMQSQAQDGTRLFSQNGSSVIYDFTAETEDALIATTRAAVGKFLQDHGIAATKAEQHTQEHGTLKR